MSIVNWDVFNINFEEQTTQFEYFAYQLFCYEFKQKYGIFRFYNQPYIETEPIHYENDFIGFQAKYYDSGTHLSDRKGELISAIESASKKYKGLNRFIIYTNKEFGASTNKESSQPKTKEEIENAGKRVGISVEWRMQSHFEKLALEKDLSNVFDYFFNPNKGIKDFLKKLDEHRSSIFSTIHSSIIHNGITYKLERPALDVDAFLEGKNQVMFVFGEGGCGKSAIVKDALYLRSDLTVYVFRAIDFDFPSMSDVSSRFGGKSMEDFCSAFADSNKKICVIESAENVFNSRHRTTFIEFYRFLIKYNWKVVFTIRISFIDAFVNQIIETSNFDNLEVNKITSEELENFGKDNGITMPENKIVLDYISNLFYLSMYINTNVAKSANSINEFLDKIWDSVICKKGNNYDIMPDQRGNIATDIAISIINKGVPYTLKNSADTAIVQSFQKDGIIYYDDKFEGYRLAHDVYQEIIIKHFISKSFISRIDNKSFFENIGNAIIIRKIFRSWLNDQINSLRSEITELISDVLLNNSITHIWKDEILITLLNEESSVLFELVENYLRRDGFANLDRTAVLLNTSCRIVNTDILKHSENYDDRVLANIYRLTKPYGNGWSNFISFVWKNKDIIEWSSKSIMYIATVLITWVQNNLTGKTTKEAGLLALFFCEIYDDQTNQIHLNSNTKDLIFNIISCSGSEIYQDVDIKFSCVISNEKIGHSIFDEVMKYILSDANTSYNFCKYAPNLVRKWAKTLWLMQPKSHDLWDCPDIFSDSESFGINPMFTYDHYHSAYFTPIYALLKNDPWETLLFIIDFFNKTTEKYYHSKRNIQNNEIYVVYIHISDSENVKQYCNEMLWFAYRGIGNAPCLYCNILMALEKWMYEYISKCSNEEANSLCKILIERSNSVALTSVVESMVLAYHQKLFPMCCILMRTKEFFEIDIRRSIQERQDLLFANFGTSKMFLEEREESNKLKFRKNTLENIVWQYQHFRTNDESIEIVNDRLDTIHNIIDKTFGDFDQLNETDKLLLCRLDSRRHKLNCSIVEEGICIESEPILTEELIEYQQKSQQEVERINKRCELSLWVYAHLEGKANEYQKYAKYEENPMLAFEELEKNGLLINNKRSFVQFSSVIICDFFNSVDSETLSACSEVIREYFWGLIQSGEYEVDIMTINAAIRSLSYMFNSYYSFGKLSLRNPIIIVLCLLLRKSFRKNVLGMVKKHIYTNHKEEYKHILQLYILLVPYYKKEVSWGGKTLKQFYKNHRRDIRRVLQGDNIGYENVSLLSENELMILLIALPYECNISTPEIASAEIALCRDLFSQWGNRNDNKLHDYNLIFNFITETANNIYENPKCIHSQNILKCLGKSDNTQRFLEQIILCQNRKKNTEAFWFVWDAIYEYVVKMCESNKEHYLNDTIPYERSFYDGLDSILVSYLLASPYCENGKNPWCGLPEHKLSFFSKCIHTIGFHPAVLYSLAKVANTIAFDYLNESVNWVSKVIESNTNLSHNFLLSETIFYLENLIQRYILQNEDELRIDPQKRRKAMIVLDFLVERGSTMAYLLRERIC